MLCIQPTIRTDSAYCKYRRMVINDLDIYTNIVNISLIPCSVDVNGMGIVDDENAVGLLGNAECRTSYPTLL